MSRPLAAAFLLSLGLGASAHAAGLDVSASYKMKASAYSNLHYNINDRNNHSFIANDARLGIAVRKIPLEGQGGGDASMDLGLVLHALGVAGSTTALASPFNRVAAYYPNTDLTPFIENAYVRVNRLWGYPWEATFGRQSFRLGSGLLLDDDGAGLTGASLSVELPWAAMKAEAFIFNDRNPLNSAGPSSLDLFGGSLELPTEGVWQINQLFERDRSANQIVYGCSYSANPTLDGCAVSKAFRSFTSLRYQISYGPMVFDGEAAMQRGTAVPTGTSPSPERINFNGNAQVVRMKWKQSLYKSREGIARASVARGSGDQPGTQATDEAFFPSRGHRHNGLERAGFGELFAATPYDGFGGNYSTSTPNGLASGASGLIVVGFGYTPPAYRGFALDVDYFLYQAERIRSGSRTLGMEWDVRLRYPIRDQFNLAASMAYFKAGKATDSGRSVSRKYSFEVSGRF
ncbi:MAG: hypothetical protein AAB036_03660 [Elusimicrobiota bacterium]